MTLTSTQVDALLAPLHPSRVRQAQGQAHLEAWDVRRHLLRVFGWGGWDFTVVSCDLVAQLDTPPPSSGGKTRYTVVYRVLGRLTIKDPAGQVLAVYEDGATGDAANQPSLGDAHDMAMKTALSQALKRCAMNLGDGFGLSLYNNGRTEAVVGRSLAHEAAAVAATDHVEGGEIPADTPPAAEPVTDARWLQHWRESTLLAESVGVLRGQWGALAAAVAAGTLTEADAAEGRALVEERVADLQQQPGPVQKAEDDLARLTGAQA